MAEFCAALRRLQQVSGLSRAELARRVQPSCGRTQLYAILDGRIHRPPEWDRLVEPLIRACIGDDERAVASWRREHGALVRVYDMLPRRDRPGPTPLPAVGSTPPAQLPADVDVFTGRADELAYLDRLLPTGRAAAADSTAVVISAVSGTAGVGKTTLALRWAHRVRREFPDGQLYVNLRGYDPDQPMTAGDALAGFLRALGIAAQDIPPDVDERSAAYRSRLDGRRMLVVLDNASGVEQVRPLLPGSPSCLVVVTSRDALAGLVARHGARRLDLDLLPPDEAMALLRALIGDRVNAESDALTALAGQCARLPLALRVAAELAASRPASSLAELVGELADEQRRLDLLDAGGDPRTAVRAVFAWSYRHLPSEAARAFRLIGLHPGPDCDPYAAAALANTSRDQVHRLLGLLVRAHLIAPTNPGRYGMHDLLRAYATHLAIVEDTEEERRAALTRLFDHYLTTAAVAMDIVHPAEQHRRPRISVPAASTSPVTDPSTARTWLDAERATLTTACAHTATHGWPGHTIRLASTVFRYLDTGGHYPDALNIHTHALRAARDIGDLSAESYTLCNLGEVYWRQGQYQQAADHHRRALTLAREIGDRLGQARALTDLGEVYWRQGRCQQAADHHRQALTLAREIGDQTIETHALTSLGVVYWRQGRYQDSTDHHQQAVTLAHKIGDQAGEAYALTNLGLARWRQGQYQQAADHHQQSLTLARAIPDRAVEARALTNLGGVYLQQARYDEAVDHHRQALALARDIGERSAEARALTNLGRVYLLQARYDEAVDHHRQALALARDIGEQAGEIEALNGLGETHQATGQPREACIHHNDALTLAARIGDRYEQARAHTGLADAHYTSDNADEARYHRREALTLYRDLAVPDPRSVPRPGSPTAAPTQTPAPR